MPKDEPKPELTDLLAHVIRQGEATTPMPDDEPPIDSVRAIDGALRVRDEAQRLIIQARNLHQRIIFAEANAALEEQERADGAGTRGFPPEARAMPEEKNQTAD
jgi:hypothetical protein